MHEILTICEKILNMGDIFNKFYMHTSYVRCIDYGPLYKVAYRVLIITLILKIFKNHKLDYVKLNYI